MLLDKILDDMAKRENSEIDPATLAVIAADLRQRMTEATKPHAAKLPKALLHDGEVLILTPGGCSLPDASVPEGTKEK